MPKTKEDATIANHVGRHKQLIKECVNRVVDLGEYQATIYINSNNADIREKVSKELVKYAEILLRRREYSEAFVSRRLFDDELKLCFYRDNNRVLPKTRDHNIHNNLSCRVLFD